MKDLCNEINTPVQKMKETFADTSDISFVLRTVIPMYLECVRLCDTNKTLNESQSVLRQTLNSISEVADDMQDRLRKAKSASVDTFLSELAGTKPDSWLSTEASRETFAQSAIKSFIEVSTRISDCATKLNSRIGKL